MNTPVYIVRRAAAPPELAGRWDGPVWGPAPKMAIAHFHPRSSDHRPVTEAALLYDDEHLHALFRVADRYVRSVHTAYDSDTYQDSCVELFIQPPGRIGYFALEVNAGGAFSLRYIEDPTRTSNRFAKWTTVAPDVAATVRIAHALPPVVEPERTEPRGLVGRGVVAVRGHGALLRSAAAGGRPAMARQRLQMRRPDVAPPLGQLGADRGGAQLPPAGALSAGWNWPKLAED